MPALTQEDLFRKSPKLIVDGCESAHDSLTVSNKPGKRVMREAISSLFGDGLDDTRASMGEFASLTGVRAHPGNYLLGSGEYYPILGLGSVVQDNANRYWICLQASCDSVRLTEDTAFLFAPLSLCEDHIKPELVVPVLNTAGEVEFLGLKLEKTAYSKAFFEPFTPDNDTRTVKATKIRGREGLYFKAQRKKHYLWVADLKQRRALRIA